MMVGRNVRQRRLLDQAIDAFRKLAQAEFNRDRKEREHKIAMTMLAQSNADDSLMAEYVKATAEITEEILTKREKEGL